jgi:hypothetical protein
MEIGGDLEGTRADGRWLRADSRQPLWIGDCSFGWFTILPIAAIILGQNRSPKPQAGEPLASPEQRAKARGGWHPLEPRCPIEPEGFRRQEDPSPAGRTSDRCPPNAVIWPQWPKRGPRRSLDAQSPSRPVAQSPSRPVTAPGESFIRLQSKPQRRLTNEPK